MDYRTVVYPAITACALIALWVYAVEVMEVPNYILPTPVAVLEAIRIGYIEGQYWPHFGYTLQNTVLGYALGCGLGILLGVALAESRTFELFIYPYIVALQSTPKIAIAPLILVWFGFGVASKVVMVVLMSFFPMFINTVVGVRSANTEMIDLMRAYSASRFLMFRAVKLPSAASHIFAGLQISVVLALIGEVVAEFISSTKGLGYLIQSAAVNVDIATMFASLFSLVMIGIFGTMFMRFLYSRIVFWENTEAMNGNERGDA